MKFTYTIFEQKFNSTINEWIVSAPFAIISSDKVDVPSGVTREVAKEKLAKLKTAFYSLVDKRAFGIPPTGTEGKGFLVQIGNESIKKPIFVGVYKAADNRTRTQDSEQRFFWVVDDEAELDRVIGDLFQHLKTVLPRLLQSME